MLISLVAAIDHNHLIGDGEEIPWYLPSDFKRFKQITTGHAIVMGRRTHESIGRALPKRLNIVLSRDPDYQPAPGCQLASSAEQAITMAQEAGLDLFVVGGAGVYLRFLDRADRLQLSIVHGEFKGTVFFPRFELDDWDWRLEETVPADDRHSHAHSYLVFDKKPERQPQAQAHQGAPIPEALRALDPAGGARED